MAIYTPPDASDARQRVHTAFLHNAKLGGDQKKLHLETIITDLDYTTNTALVADSWDDLRSCQGLW